jgi:hypothetical protein
MKLLKKVPVKLYGMWVYLIPGGIDLGQLTIAPGDGWEHLETIPGLYKLNEAKEYLQKHFPHSKNIVVILAKGQDCWVVSHQEIAKRRNDPTLEKSIVKVVRSKEKSCLKCIFLGTDFQSGKWRCGQEMWEYLFEAQETEGMKTDCPVYEYQEGMTFNDRVKRLIKNVMKSR